MELLLTGLGILAASGLVALLMGRWSRAANVVGATGAVAGSLVGLVPAWVTLIGGRPQSESWPWDVPYGSFSIELDSLSALFVMIVLGLTGIVAVHAAGYLDIYHKQRSLGVTWFFFNLMAASMTLVAIARNGVLFLVAWETMSVASYFLVTFYEERPGALEAGRNYLIATHLGTAFLFVLFILLGRQAGSLDFNDIAGNIPESSANLLFLLAVVGFGTKAGFMPFHVWLPDAYPVAPSFVAAIMSGAMSKLGIYGLLRVLAMMPVYPEWWAWLLIAIGVVSGVYGILTGLAQSDLKRLLAYSSVENLGLIAMGLGMGLLGISTATPGLTLLGFLGGLLHLVNHALFKSLLFLGSGVIVRATGTRDLNQLGGLAKRMPRFAIAMLVGCVAIAGLPPLNGFVSEFLIYLAAFTGQMRLGTGGSAGMLLVIAAVTISGGLGAVAFTSLFGIAFLGQPRNERAATALPVGPLLVAPVAILAAACVVVALFVLPIVQILLPIVSLVAHWELGGILQVSGQATQPLGAITLGSIALIAVSLGLAILRLALLAGRRVTQGGTWGCGYLGPTPRMQYTATSYVQPAVDFFAPVLLTRTRLETPLGLFPRRAMMVSQTDDFSKEAIYRPLFLSVEWVSVRLRWLQHGRVHIYILYLGVTIIALLTWYLSNLRSLPGG
ncbi:MAG TPA: proton-conducting transporter membrane subunit [Pirellulales bacterium]|jgi:formate hydrogenlyase subunit 3/multisubunit Na+/H+ antiporter MnhD subunit|nr:proton-conducting transporter membrane subunit [Pirellulales bacterium]